ncbi:hypothetical protein AWI85_06125 [Listeria monocytogenes]|uniref:hypothetical protein n=1 Tax=Listeria monocytogenes TaxID=1639 RepID=UPI000775F8DA|nr:hypothetical protein [Listeria monocytogenes]KXS79288.1 hypothetical protein AWI86_05415 [Listeria monocytogenes]KXS81576.1 hypothetical protein AWI85_06125 [Listeria monocytogenes]KXX12520.1 hypothetical protein AWI84_06345 [Listeria monocytogenes]KXX18738.1 hypothetical protein AWI83_06345 [Listeria monocytogenes]KXX21416.1 hypothetical protein AWI82_06345 [Listeria monocytogenes]
MINERQKLLNSIYQQLGTVRTHSERYADNVSEKMLTASNKELELILGDVISYQLDYERKMEKHPPRRSGNHDYR